jgi:HPr kinase/phosphorylase
MSRELLHASCVALNGKGVLVRGVSGSGKSDLVLRLIDGEGFGRGDLPVRGRMVADDQVYLSAENGKLVASPPANLAGLLEIRGRGIERFPYTEKVMVYLVVDLQPVSQIPRMPELNDLEVDLLGIKLPRILIDPIQNSAPARIRSFLF